MNIKRRHLQMARAARRNFDGRILVLYRFKDVARFLRSDAALYRWYYAANHKGNKQ